MIFPQAMTRGLARGLAGVLLLAFGAPAAQARGEASVWSMKGERNTVYLAGSVHALPEGNSQFPEPLDRAYREAEVIVLEVDLEEMNPLDAVEFITTNGTLPADKTLKDVVGEKSYERIRALATSLEVPEIVIAKLEPWAAALILTQYALTKTGFDANLGIDMQITERARVDGKPVEGLETVIDQLSVFDDRSFEEQTRFLLDSADDAPNLKSDLQKLIAAWRSGDLRALEKEFIHERAKSPELYDALLGVRNRKWLPKIEALLKEERDYLVVVGALHFVGRDGLLALLRSNGHKATALPAAKTPH
ncbi:MAG TPA: TraB/GumN family protein [Steroidobacteraceae bacterium]|nr:TraB/GumN family protein [Steroidobacteraceae bacterium]